MSEERMRILQMVSEGTITVEQAAQLIQALEESDTPDEALEVFTEDVAQADVFEPFEVVEQAETIEAEEMPQEPAAEETPYHAGSPQAEDRPETETSRVPADFNKWRRFWYLPLGVGIVITAISGLLMNAGIQEDWHWFWMSCIWLPLLFGITVILFSWMSRTARWLHVRVNTGQDEWPRRIAISLPLPLRLSAWLMRAFGRFIPGLDDVPVPIDEAILALEKSLSPTDPLYVHVEDSGGEEVEVYIG